MISAERVETGRFSAVQRTGAQHRILDVALTLIADHGVGGTSLQMIAGGDAGSHRHRRRTPLVTDIDDDELRAQLLLLTRRLLVLPE